jgi:hypothetical protein
MSEPKSSALRTQRFGSMKVNRYLELGANDSWLDPVDVGKRSRRIRLGHSCATEVLIGSGARGEIPLLAPYISNSSLLALLRSPYCDGIRCFSVTISAQRNCKE